MSKKIKVLYLTNIEVPYRVKFFNELSQYCDLTVLYERRKSKNRDKAWTESEKGVYNTEYLDGICIGNESSFSLKILKHIFKKYDCVIVGCYNSPIQMVAMLVMRIFKIPFFINVDGETFLEGNSFKCRMKRFFLQGADKYLVAGQRPSQSIKKTIKGANVVSYPFSSMTKEDVETLADSDINKRNDEILVVGQFFDYKGMDIALKAAVLNKELRYKFIGMGIRTAMFEQLAQIPEADNIEIIPFLNKEDLLTEYKHCKMLVLPSRRECWGLVVNEAAACGTPIVSTWGSGAAVEFISDKYPQFLAKPGDEHSLYTAIEELLVYENYEEYSNYLKEKSIEYTIENCVDAHLKALNIVS